MDQHAQTPLDAAVQIIGGQVALASLCKVTPQAVNQWVKKGKAPAEHVLTIEEASGVSRYELLPAVFGSAPHSSQHRPAA